MTRNTHVCNHCQKTLSACLCAETGRLDPFKAACRLLLAPEAYGPDMERAVAQFLGAYDPTQTAR